MNATEYFYACGRNSEGEFTICYGSEKEDMDIIMKNELAEVWTSGLCANNEQYEQDYKNCPCIGECEEGQKVVSLLK
jgi:hypothetical protein